MKIPTFKLKDLLKSRNIISKVSGRGTWKTLAHEPHASEVKVK